MDPREHVRRQYDRAAHWYDRFWRHYTTPTLDLLTVRLLRYPPGRLLDVGCGTGALEARLAVRWPGAPLVGVDLSRAMLAAARRKLGDPANVSFVQASADALSFPDAHFDLVVSASAFHYFPRPVAALREMRRVLRPDGTLLLLDWCRDLFPMPLLDAVLRRFDAAHRRTYTQTELRRMLVEAGFCVQRVTTHRRLLVWGLMMAEAVIVDRR